MQRGDHLLVHRLDGHRASLVVARRLEQRLRVAAVGLVAPHVAMHVVGGQQADRMPALLELARPVVRTAARLEQHRRRRLLREERQKRHAREAVESMRSLRRWQAGRARPANKALQPTSRAQQLGKTKRPLRAARG